MDKYAVETKNKEKTASEKTICPICGSEVITKEDGTLMCPRHGTRPFEVDYDKKGE